MATCNACGADRRTGICPFCGQRSRVREDDSVHAFVLSRHPADNQREDDDPRNAERGDYMHESRR